MAEQEQLQKNASTTVADTQNSSEYLETRAFAPVVKSRTGSSEQPTPPNIQTKANSSRPIGHSFANVMIQAPAASVVQPKLAIGEPGDKYEQEADNVAAQVVQQINSPAVSSKNQKSVQRQQASEEEELQMKPVADVIQRVKTSEEEELQMKSAADSGRNASADLETSISQARGGGQSLNDSIRQPMEQAFGADFSGVKVHTDGKSDQLNQSIQAKAFTTGEDIFFRQGEYNPGNKGGQELLAHELTHVVQQSGSKVQAKLVNQSSSLSSHSGLVQRNLPNNPNPTQNTTANPTQTQNPTQNTTPTPTQPQNSTQNTTPTPTQTQNPTQNTTPTPTQPQNIKTYVVSKNTSIYDKSTGKTFWTGSEKETLNSKAKAKVGDILQLTTETKETYAKEELFSQVKHIASGKEGSVKTDQVRPIFHEPKPASPSTTMILMDDKVLHKPKDKGRKKNIGIDGDDKRIPYKTKLKVDKEAIGVNKDGEDAYYYVKNPNDNKEGYISISDLGDSARTSHNTQSKDLNDSNYVLGYVRTKANTYDENLSDKKSISIGTPVLVNFSIFKELNSNTYIAIKLLSNEGEPLDKIRFIQEYKVIEGSKKSEANVDLEEDSESAFDNYIEKGLSVLEVKSPFDEVSGGLEQGYLKKEDGGYITDNNSQQGSTTESVKNGFDAAVGSLDIFSGIFGFAQNIKKFVNSRGTDKIEAFLDTLGGMSNTASGITKAVDSSIKTNENGNANSGWDAAGKWAGTIADGISAVKDIAMSIIGFIKMDKNSSQKLKTGADLGVQMLQAIQSGIKVAKGFFDIFDSSGVPTKLFDAVPAVGIAINAAQAIISFKYKVTNQSGNYS